MRLRIRASQPRPAKPARVIVQVEGSGTPGVSDAIVIEPSPRLDAPPAVRPDWEQARQMESSAAAVAIADADDVTRALPPRVGPSPPRRGKRRRHDAVAGRRSRDASLISLFAAAPSIFSRPHGRALAPAVHAPAVKSRKPRSIARPDRRNHLPEPI